MFTVIFLSGAAKKIFGRSEIFFRPFLDDGDIEFCEWNESPRAETLAQALPRLREIIQGKAEWRAVVVDHAASEIPGVRDAENPFDFADSVRPHLELRDSPHAIVRLAHQLLGYPALTAREFTPSVTYRAPDGARIAAQIEDGEDHHQTLSRLSRTESDVRVEYQEVQYSEADKQAHAALREKYRMKEVNPTEVVFISTRSRQDADENAMLQRAWRTEDDQHVSRFVERNDYPPASRFAVYDMLNIENSGYDQDELRFWISVLTVAINTLPPSSFQAERVYQLDVGFSDPALGDLLNEHMSRLTSLREHLDSLIDRPERPPETDVEELLRDEKVHLEFESIGGSELAVQTTGYGLASDVPVNERAKWARDFDQLEINASQFVRRPRRVLARAVFDARTKSRHHLDDVHVLSEIDREEIEDELLKRVRTLTVPATTEILDRDRLRRDLRRENDRVRVHISERLRLRTIAVASALVLATWLAAFVPYLVQAAGKGIPALQWSIFVVAVVVVLLAITGVLTLWWMRRQLVALLDSVNGAMRAFVSKVNGGAAVFGEYLSGLVTYMHARAVLIGADRLNERDAERVRRYRSIRAKAVETISTERMIVKSLGQPLTVRRITTGFAEFDVDDPKHIDSFFEFPKGARHARFNDSGEFVDAPYDFIDRMRLDRVRIFEPVLDLRSEDLR